MRNITASKNLVFGFCRYLVDDNDLFLSGVCLRRLFLFRGCRSRFFLWRGLFGFRLGDLLWSKYSEHLVAFHLWRYLNVTKFHKVRRQPLQYLCTKLAVRHFSSTEGNRSSNFIAFLQPVACSLHSIA